MNADERTLHDQLTEFALGTLEPEQCEAVEALLESSEAARAELRAIQAALVAVVEGLPQHAPSASVRGRLEAAIAAEPTPRSIRPPTKRGPANRPSWRGRRSAPPRPSAWSTGVLGLVAVAALVWGGWNVRVADGLVLERQRVAEMLTEPHVQRIALYGALEDDAAEVALGSLLRDDDRAVFVLLEPPRAGTVYQAWGHTSNEWEPGTDERLTSLQVARAPVFEVAIDRFAALYLSVEPLGGSDQPTRPVARVSLLDPVVERPLVIVGPESGTVTGGSVVVRGAVDTSVASVRYSLNDAQEIEVVVAGNRFAFTIGELGSGQNAIEVRATLRSGETVIERIEVTAP